MRFLSGLIMTAIILASCTSSNVTSLKDYKEDLLIISNGGGVTGQWTSWYILSNGQLFRQAGTEGATNFVRKLSKQKTKECFELVTSLNLKDQSFSHPGNMTYVLGLKHGNDTWQVKWGESGVEAPKGVEQAYSKILSIINQ